MKYCKIVLLIPFILLLSNGCNEEEFFELKHPPEFPYQNVTELERSVIGLYHKTLTNRDWENPWVNHVILRESIGDHVGFADNPEWDYWRNLEDWTRYTFRAWVYFYQVINSANFTLDYLRDNDFNPYPDISQDDREYNLNRIIGELHFMRGFAYYHLALMHCSPYDPNGANDNPDIPLRRNYSENVDQARAPQIGTTEEIYNFMISDFEKAKEYLPEEYIEGLMHPSYQAGRANKFAAAAMLARVYFQMHEFKKAEKECDFIIEENGGLYDLSEDPIEAYNKSSLERGKEVIMYAACYDDVDAANQGFFHLTVLNHRHNGDFCTWVETHMAENTLKRIGWMPDPLGDTTITGVARRDKRFQQLFAVREPYTPALLQKPGRYYETRSYFDYRTIVADKLERGPGERYTNYPMIRLAEIYLTRSVCRLLDGNKQGAADDLNVVRQRAWDENVGGAFQAVSASEITEEMISDERLIELFAEGDRVHYLKGLMNEIPPGDRVERGHTALPWDSPDLIWSIPTEETQLNESY
jgi:starch-binding outer membrane protein, SusD/RagB family